MTVETETLNDEIQRILAASEEPLTTQDIYQRSDLAESPADAAKAIRELHEAGAVVDWPAAEGGRRRRYWIAGYEPTAAEQYSGESDAADARHGGSAQGSAGASASGQAQRRRVGRREVREVFRGRSGTFTARGVAIDLGMDDSRGRECVAQVLSDLARNTGEIVRLGSGWYVLPEPPDVVEPERYGLTSDGCLQIYYSDQDRPTELSREATRELARFVAACWIGIDPLGGKEASHE